MSNPDPADTFPYVAPCFDCGGSGYFYYRVADGDVYSWGDANLSAQSPDDENAQHAKAEGE